MTLDVESGVWTLRRQIEALAGPSLADSVFQQAGAGSGASLARSLVGGEGAPDPERSLRDCVGAFQAAGFGQFVIERAEPLGTGELHAIIRGRDCFESWMFLRKGTAPSAPVCHYAAGVFVGFVSAIADRRDVVCVERQCQALGADACVFDLMPSRVAESGTAIALDPDPAFSQQLGLLEIFFDRMPMGIGVFDRDLRLRRCNPTWSTLTARYSGTPESRIVPGTSLFEVAPGIESAVLPMVKRVLAGETIRGTNQRLESRGIVSYWDVALAPLLEEGEVNGVVAVITDATERRIAEDELRLRTETDLKIERDFNSAVLDTAGALVVVLDGEGRIIRFNRECERVTGYRSEEVFGQRVEKLFLIPEEISLVEHVLGEIYAGQYPNHAENHWLTKDGRRRLIAWSNTAITDGSGVVKYAVATGIDVTEQRAAEEAMRQAREELEHRVRERTAELSTANRALRESYQLLEQRVDERTRELRTLLDVSQNVTSTLDLETVLGLILDQLGAVVDYDGAAVMRLVDRTLVPVAYRGPVSQHDAMSWRFDFATQGVVEEIARTWQPVIVPDVLGDTPMARSYQRSLEGNSRVGFGHVRSWMGIPLLVRDRIVGMLSLDHEQPNHYSVRQSQLAMAFASHAAVAMENARLYQEERERREEAEQRRAVAEGLRSILAVLNSNRSLEEVLDFIVGEACRILGTSSGAVYRLHGDGYLTIQSANGLPDSYIRMARIPVGQGAVGRAVVERKPVVLENLFAAYNSQDPSPSPEERQHIELLIDNYRALLAVPLIVKEDVYGGIVMYYPTARQFEPEEISLAVSFCDQAALAIENARLREQAQEVAVAAERSRLARDLHDAVTQTLFSASLIAEVLPRLYQRSPEMALSKVAELRDLTRGALAEMRTLLLELRPSALAEASLGDLVRQLGAATTGRARIPVTLHLDGECNTIPEVKVALYRIAQEALNNVAKHSQSEKAIVTLRCADDVVELSIRDEGKGFDTSMVKPSHLGLGIMRERANVIGARLSVDSEPGRGTTVSVVWPA